MGIQKITNALRTTVNSAAKKVVAKTSQAPKTDGITHKIASKASAIAESTRNGIDKVKTSIISAKDKAAAKLAEANDAYTQKSLQQDAKFYAAIANDYKMKALVAEGMSTGLKEKEAQKGAEALVSITGEMTGKSAEKSAQIFEEKAPVTPLELKMNLENKWKK